MTLQDRLVDALHALSQKNVNHRRECPGGRMARMLRWERVDLNKCDCAEFAVLRDVLIEKAQQEPTRDG